MTVRAAAISLLALLAGRYASAQPPDATSAAVGEQVFTRACAACHVGGSDARAPSLEAMRGLDPAAVVASLESGKMAVQGELLSPIERRRVAEFLSGRAFAAAAAAPGGACTSTPPFVDSLARPAWNGWGAGTANTRFQPAKIAGLTAADVPRLTLAWAFGFTDALAARTQPSVLGAWLFTAGENGDVYALDSRTGCTRWQFRAAAAVRTAPLVVAYDANRHAVLVGDGRANAYLLDAETGRLVWTRKLDEHPNAAITGGAAAYEGRAYFVTSAAGEEVRGRNPDYACCTFRGSVSALDLRSGELVWQTPAIEMAPGPRGTSTTGVQLFGPAGAGIWGAPTIDPARGVLYVGTGNGFAGPPQPAMNAILALDLRTGARRWLRQTVPNDIWLWQCDAEASANPNCPEKQGPDFDFGASPLLTTTGRVRELLVVPQKSGVVYALDPDAAGAVVWEYRIGAGSALGGQWGAAADGRNAYVGVGDTLGAAPGGVHAIDLDTGRRAWFAPPAPTLCAGGAEQRCFAAQGGAVTAIPGVVFSGGSDGGLRAYSTADGALLWQFDTNRDFATVNGVRANGATIDAAGPVAVGGMLFVNSGYNGIVGRAGNVLLAFRLE
jgi:polyvinyl alcohol dehydrogenase (cytochrome)